MAPLPRSSCVMCVSPLQWASERPYDLRALSDVYVGLLLLARSTWSIGWRTYWLVLGVNVGAKFQMFSGGLGCLACRVWT